MVGLDAFCVTQVTAVLPHLPHQYAVSLRARHHAPTFHNGPAVGPAVRRCMIALWIGIRHDDMLDLFPIGPALLAVLTYPLCPFTLHTMVQHASCISD